MLLSLPSLACSVRRYVREHSLLTLGLILLSASLTATFVSAMFHTDGFSDLISMGKSIYGIDIPMSFVAGVLFVCSSAVNIITFVFVRYVRSTNFWKWIISLMLTFLLCNLIVGIFGSVFTGQSIDMCFFASCCASMGIVGVAWGLTYKEIFVLVNIYLQGGICLLSALWLTWNAFRAYLSRKTIFDAMLMAIGITVGGFYFAAFLWLCNHYAMPITDAYNLCYHEMKQLAREFHTTYNIVNYFIFILLFLTVVIINLAAGALMKMRTKKNPRHDTEEKGE